MSSTAASFMKHALKTHTSKKSFAVFFESNVLCPNTFSHCFVLLRNLALALGLDAFTRLKIIQTL